MLLFGQPTGSIRIKVSLGSVTPPSPNLAACVFCVCCGWQEHQKDDRNGKVKPEESHQLIPHSFSTYTSSCWSGGTSSLGWYLNYTLCGKAIFSGGPMKVGPTETKEMPHWMSHPRWKALGRVAAWCSQSVRAQRDRILHMKAAVLTSHWFCFEQEFSHEVLCGDVTMTALLCNGHAAVARARMKNSSPVTFLRQNCLEVQLYWSTVMWDKVTFTPQERKFVLWPQEIPENLASNRFTWFFRNSRWFLLKSTNWRNRSMWSTFLSNSLVQIERRCLVCQKNSKDKVATVVAWRAGWVITRLWNHWISSHLVVEILHVTTQNIFSNFFETNGRAARRHRGREMDAKVMRTWGKRNVSSRSSARENEAAAMVNVAALHALAPRIE